MWRKHKLIDDFAGLRGYHHPCQSFGPQVSKVHGSTPLEPCRRDVQGHLHSRRERWALDAHQQLSERAM